MKSSAKWALSVAIALGVMVPVTAYAVHPSLQQSAPTADGTAAAIATGAGLASGSSTAPSLPTVQPPTEVSVSALGSAQVTVTWSAAANATQYLLYRQQIGSGLGAQQVGTTAGTSFQDNSVSPGTTYDYWVVATNSAGQARSLQMATVRTYVPWAQIHAADADSIVLLKVYNSVFGVFSQNQEYGTGWIAPNGDIVTCLHVVRHAKYEIDVYPFPENPYSQDSHWMHAQVVARDSRHDLALLKVVNDAAWNPTPLPIGGGAATGQPVAVLGHPGAAELTLTDGSVLQTGLSFPVQGVGSLDHMTWTDIPSVQGNSGAPVFNHWGQVVGIMESVSEDNGDSSYYVPVTELAQWGMSGVSQSGPTSVPAS